MDRKRKIVSKAVFYGHPTIKPNFETGIYDYET